MNSESPSRVLASFSFCVFIAKVSGTQCACVKTRFSSCYAGYVHSCNLIFCQNWFIGRFVCFFLWKNANDLGWWCLIYHLHGAPSDTWKNLADPKKFFSHRIEAHKATEMLISMSMATAKPQECNRNWFSRFVAWSKSFFDFLPRDFIVERASLNFNLSNTCFDSIASMTTLHLFPPFVCTISKEYHNERGREIKFISYTISKNGSRRES